MINVNVPVNLILLLVTAVFTTSAASDTGKFSTAIVVFLGGNSTRNRPMMNGPIAAPNDHIA